MQKEIISFIEEKELNPFSKEKTSVRNSTASVFKTLEAKSIHQKVISKISEQFNFADTSNILQYFSFTQNKEEIEKRQTYFKILTEKNSDFLSELKIPKSWWKPNYSVLVVTENEQTFLRLREAGCPAKLLISERDIIELQVYEVIQAIDCEQYLSALEQLPQSIFIKSINEAYLERYVGLLSAWSQNIEIMQKKCKNESLLLILREIEPLLKLLGKEETKKLTREEVEKKIDEMNENIGLKVRELTLSGNLVLQMLSKKDLPQELKSIVEFEIEKSQLPEEIFFKNIPVIADENELEKIIRLQNIEESTNMAEIIKENSSILSNLPSKFEMLASRLLLFDFETGIARFAEKLYYPTESSELDISLSKNLFLDNPQPISFSLNEFSRCSILTGANSGGKTTLIEHLVQIISLFQIGLPASGSVRMPLFSEVYYFAKNKGSASKGAFETLLTQMAQIKTGEKTLILADEIEAVTEPGVAGKIIASTADYFIQKGCFLIIATHLGREIKDILPKFTRIDGIEAKGLDENNELIVDHNPVLGRLAHSTPELIVEKMAKSQRTEYFIKLWENLKK